MTRKAIAQLLERSDTTIGEYLKFDTYKEYSDYNKNRQIPPKPTEPKYVPTDINQETLEVLKEIRDILKSKRVIW